MGRAPGMEPGQENLQKCANHWFCEVLVGWKRWKHVFCPRLQDSFIPSAGKKALGDTVTSKVACYWSPTPSTKTALALCFAKPLKEQLCQGCTPLHIMVHSGSWGPTPNKSNSCRDKGEPSDVCTCTSWEARRDFPGAEWRFSIPICLSANLTAALGERTSWWGFHVECNVRMESILATQWGPAHAQ